MYQNIYIDTLHIYLTCISHEKKQIQIQTQYTDAVQDETGHMQQILAIVAPLLSYQILLSLSSVNRNDDEAKGDVAWWMRQSF